MDRGVTDKYAQFLMQLSVAGERLKAIPSDACVRLVTHLDADGIAACSILVKVLMDMHRQFSISVVKNLTRNLIQTFAEEPYSHYIFTDVGSYALSWIREGMQEKHTIIILDHHEGETANAAGSAGNMEHDMEHILHINPHLYTIDGDSEVAGAGVAYLFARQLHQQYKSLAHLAVVGAIAERQERNGFTGLNKMILQEAIDASTITMHFGLRCFGFQSKPLPRLLEQSHDPHIPGVTGSGEGALAFLSELGLEAKQNNAWRRLSDLSLAEAQRLIQGIILRRAGEEKPEDVWGCSYVLAQESEDSPLRDAREFATILNACGRLGHAMLAIGICLGDKSLKRQALEAQALYREELQNALRWFRDHRHSRHVIEENGFVVINFEDSIRPSILGTFVSILAHQHRFPKGTLLLGLARDYDGQTKTSLRIADDAVGDSVDARLLLHQIMRLAGGNYGGHKAAAGGIFLTAKEPYFLEAAKDVLRAASAI